MSSRCIRAYRCGSRPVVPIWSPSVQVVKSRWSVKATPGKPAATACSQLCTMDASRGASHDHSVCTWLSTGGDQLGLACACSAGWSDGCCAEGTPDRSYSYRGWCFPLSLSGRLRGSRAESARLPAGLARRGRGDDVDLTAVGFGRRRRGGLGRLQRGRGVRRLDRLGGLLAVAAALPGCCLRGDPVRELLPAVFPLGDIPVAGAYESDRDRQRGQPQAAG